MTRVIRRGFFLSLIAKTNPFPLFARVTNFTERVMRKIFVGALFTAALVPSFAFAQAIKQGTASSAGDAGSNIPLCRASAAAETINTEDKYGYLSCDLDGNVRTTGTASLSWSGSTTDPSKLEDAPSVAGDRGMFMLGIQNRAGANYGSADLDYTPVSLNQFGGIKCELSTDFTDNAAKNPYRLEDAAFADGNALTVIGAVRQDTPASSTNTDGDVINLKTDGSGYLWTRLLAADSISAVTRSEDSAHASTHSGVNTLGLVRQDTAAGMAADGDYVFGAVDSANRQYVNPWGANHTEWFKACSGSDVTGTSATEVVPATASKYKYLTAVNCTNTDATVNTRVEIVENTSSPTTIWHLNLAAITGSDGFQFNPPIKSSSTNQNLGVTPITTSAEVRCCMVGFVSAN